MGADSLRIAFSNAGDIWKIGIDGNTLRQITFGAGGAAQPAWSGEAIAFSAPVSDVQTDIFSIDDAGIGPAQNLTNHLSDASTDPASAHRVTDRVHGLAEPAGGVRHEPRRERRARGDAEQPVRRNPDMGGHHAHPVRRRQPSELYVVGTGDNAVARVTETAVSERDPATTEGIVAPFAVSTQPADGDASPSVGETLHAYQPVWIGTLPMTTSYAWQQCAADGTACAPIPGAERILVHADGGGRRSPIGVVAVGDEPWRDQARPLRVGARTRGRAGEHVAARRRRARHSRAWSSAVASNGCLDRRAGSFTYQWRRCDGPDGDEGGAMLGHRRRLAHQLHPTDADVGHELRVSVTASASHG